MYVFSDAGSSQSHLRPEIFINGSDLLPTKFVGPLVFAYAVYGFALCGGAAKDVAKW